MKISARYRKFLLPIGLVGLVWWGISASAGPKDPKFSNVAAKSLSLTWTTARLTRGCVTAFVSGRFLKAAAFGCDDHRQKLTTHNVTLSGLEPNTEYRFLVRNGWNFKLAAGKTRELTEAMPQLPNPAYGQAVLSDGIELARYVNVFVDVNGKTKSAFTNDGGGFSIDLADAGDQKAFFLNVDGGTAGLARKLFFLGEHQPIGIIRLEPRQDINPLFSVKERPDSAKTLFHRLSRTYWDAVTINVSSPEFDVRGVAQIKYDQGLNKTLIFAAIKNLPLVENKTARLWLAKNISEYLPAGVFEFAAEAGDPVGYSVFSDDGDLRNYEEILMSYDSTTDIEKPESVVLREKIPNKGSTQ